MADFIFKVGWASHKCQASEAQRILNFENTKFAQQEVISDCFYTEPCIINISILAVDS